MKFIVPFASWAICIPANLWFYLYWGFSAIGPGREMVRAISFFWLSGPVLVGVAWLLARSKNSFSWLSLSVSVLPWCAFPWVRSLLASGEDRHDWVKLAIANSLCFLVCLILTAVIRAKALDESAPAKPHR